MPSSSLTSPSSAFDQQQLAASIDSALSRIPPLWPLKHFVAVNPFLGLVNRPFADACDLLQRVSGAAPLRSPDDYHKAFVSGAISHNDLVDAAGKQTTPKALLEGLKTSRDSEPVGCLTTVAELLDDHFPHAHWAAFVTEEISKWCAVTFDENQTTWSSPWKRNESFYASWRDAALHDANPETFGFPQFRAFVKTLPAGVDDAIVACVNVLNPPTASLTDFLHRQLLSISGWAGYAQYRVREDALRGLSNPLLEELLAVRLAYDAALFRGFANDGAFRADWRHHVPLHGHGAHFEVLAAWQSAYEKGYQRQLGLALATQHKTSASTRPIAQAVFCIDVRSEVLRRHLEKALPGIHTLGFAGFFGFPVSHHSESDESVSARCPALLVPPLTSCVPAEAERHVNARERRVDGGAWKAFQNSAASCFTFVETMGLAFGAALRQKPAGPSCSRVSPDFTSLNLEARADLAAGALRNMSLSHSFARLVLLCGHGSQSANNPYASGLDCGACGGHAGDVNARLAAATLNHPDVRAKLKERGIDLPQDTWFVAGIHNTTTDEVMILDRKDIPPSHHKDIQSLETALAQAGVDSRQERASKLGLGALPKNAVCDAIRNRASDLAQTRPEWGLANNAAFVAAPRTRTAGLNLEGRVFLHEYDASVDPENKVLTMILSAPVVVASWINLQYYASRVDPQRYGAGNKVLHNIAGGIGAMEGNLGDLKMGLPLQSIHNGNEFIHEPRRLSVYLEAPRHRIAQVLEQLPSVRQLFDNEWIHLFAIEGDACHAYEEESWRPLSDRT